MFWPYEWELKLEAQNLMVGLQYSPKVVNKMIRITIESPDNKLMIYYENIDYIPKYSFIPRLQAAAWALN